MKIIKVKEMSIQGSIILSGIIIGLSIFLTTWIFFGGDNNRQKLSVSNPALSRNVQQGNFLTPEQIQQIQQRAATQQASSTVNQKR